MTGDERLLRLAEDLGTRLLPVFDSPTGMPYMYVNLKTGMTKGSRSNPAEIGTLVLEFGTLGKLTKKPVYFDKAYYLGPDKGGAKPFALLASALRESNRCALGRWAARGTSGPGSALPRRRRRCGRSRSRSRRVG